MEDDDDDEDGEWSSDKKVETEIKAKKKAGNTKKGKKVKRENETVEIGETQTEKLKKKAKKKGHGAGKVENGNTLDNDKQIQNSLSNQAKMLNSVKNSNKKQHGKLPNQGETQEGSPAEMNNQSQVTEVKYFYISIILPCLKVKQFPDFLSLVYTNITLWEYNKAFNNVNKIYAL